MKSKKPKSPLKKNKKTTKLGEIRGKKPTYKKNKNVSKHEKDVSFRFVLNYLTVRLGTPSEVGGSR